MLRDLSKIVVPVKEKIENFIGIDCALPEQFKLLVRKINNDTVTFGQSSSVVTNVCGQHIYVSNSWFYIAATLSPLYKPFEEYRKAINEIVDKEILKSKDKAAIELKINESIYPEEDKALLIKFATDYEWWTAGSTKDGKSLDRNDCLVSAVLAIANVVNSSASYIANLWAFFGDYPDLAKILQNNVDTMLLQKQTCIAMSKLSDFVFKTIKFLEGVDRLQSFVPYIIESKSRYAETEATIIKLQSTEFQETLVGMFIETSLDEVKRRNSATSTSRWFEDEINFNGRIVYLSNQWTSEGRYQLTFTELKKFIKEAYHGRYLIDRTTDGMFLLIEISNPLTKFANTMINTSYRPMFPLQQIFFGAPGTSKSTRIKNLVGDKEQHRVTFHPDTDYAGFVGCYKPTKEETATVLKQPILDYDSLVDKFKEYLNVPNVNITKACTLFGYDYHDSIVDIQNNGHKVMDLVNDAYKSNTTYDSVVRGGMACYETSLPTACESPITYKFVAQPFVNAYVSAWKKLYDKDETQKEVFLVIEEINRGNCAQIFGDLFQLLDRNDNGYSDYSIEPDTDLGKYLETAFEGSDIQYEDIKKGKIMMLPPNLYIWATMNTSDQSLFPIDSAFKRRWDWKYTPIKNAQKGHVIQLSDRQYDWWDFLEAVNSRIEKVTESEDKQLGYWFAKPETGISISAERFVSKVVFYLWNDVFKDYGHDTNSPFVIKHDEGKKTELRFKSFFDEDGEIDENVLVQFFWGLKLETKAAVNNVVEQVADKQAEPAEESQIQEITATTVNEPDADYDTSLPEADNIDDFFK